MSNIITRNDCAGWGGVLSYAARVRQVAGVIVDGMCRDIDDSRRMDFPVFARGVVPTTARGRVIETAFNSSITVGSVLVNPNDWVIADSSGVVFLGSRLILTTPFTNTCCGQFSGSGWKALKAPASV